MKKGTAIWSQAYYKKTNALNIFRQTGFMLETKNLRFILPDNDKIY